MQYFADVSILLGVGGRSGYEHTFELIVELLTVAGSQTSFMLSLFQRIINLLQSAPRHGPLRVASRFTMRCLRAAMSSSPRVKLNTCLLKLKPESDEISRVRGNGSSGSFVEGDRSLLIGDEHRTGLQNR
ncbi:hypothetical protein U1Q18_046353 [Sarracenia purpurea var. burkii]